MARCDLSKSKKELLYEYIRQKGYVKTSDVIYDWGKKNFTTRADRYARDLAEEGRIRRLHPDKKKFYFPGIKEDVWEIVKFPESCL